MKDIIAHRINTIKNLKSIPPEYGVEVDIRSYGKKLIISHDPFVQGEDFRLWIKSYQHKLLILNVKEEGLEGQLIKIMDEESINDYFFLDQSFPFLIKNAAHCKGRSAVRYSEFESIETVMNLKGLIKWVWLDCFNTLPIDKVNMENLKSAGFKICIVSPELQGRFDDEEILEIHSTLKKDNIIVDAVCTKKINLWREVCEMS